MANKMPPLLLSFAPVTKQHDDFLFQTGGFHFSGIAAPPHRNIHRLFRYDRNRHSGDQEPVIPELETGISSCELIIPAFESH